MPVKSTTWPLKVRWRTYSLHSRAPESQQACWSWRRPEGSRSRRMTRFGPPGALAVDTTGVTRSADRVCQDETMGALMSSAPTLRGVQAPGSPASVFASVLSVAVEAAATKLNRKVAEWAGKLDGAVARGEPSGMFAPLADAGLNRLGEAGTTQKVAAEGVKAGLHGKNPIWAAIKKTWQTGTPAVKAAMIAAAAAAILLLLLSPV